MIRQATIPEGRADEIFWDNDEPPPDFDEPEAAPPPKGQAPEADPLVWCYENLGWTFTPLKGKKPLRPDWQKENRLPLDMLMKHRAGGGNIGLRTGGVSGGVIILDLDAGADSETIERLPETVMVSTGRGRHLYYAYNKPLGNTTSKIAPHIDTRADGGQGVFPGSIHPDTGNTYSFIIPPWYDDGTPRPLTQLPGWVVDKLSEVEATETWEAPVPLDAATVPPWPPAVFPPDVQCFVDALAVSTETPPELPAMLTLAALASCVAGKYRVRIKSDYFEPCNVWACVALPPGSRKSAVLQAVTSPLIQFEREQRAALAPDIQRTSSEAETTRARIEALRKKAAKAAADDMPAIREEIEHLETNMPVIPRARQLWTGDVTPERLAVLMAENDGVMAQFSDEGGVFDTLAGRYSNGIANLDVYLQGHDGRTAIRVDRGSRPPLFIENPCLALGLCPQPDVISKLADQPGFRGRGLLGRFLYAMPAVNLGRRTLDGPPMPPEVAQRYNSLVAALLAHGWNETSEGRRAYVLKLSPDAYTAWHAYALEIEGAMAAGGTFENVTDWAGKLPGAVARIAAVFHTTRYVYQNPWQHEISMDDMAAAIRLGRALSAHALIAFGMMGADESMERARAILAWIQREGRASFTRREAHAAHRSQFQRAEDLKGPLAVLCERAYIRRVGPPVPRSGRPSEVFEVNPAI